MADAPSQTCSELDCMLSEKAWKSVEHRFGPHSFDLMAMDSNCRRDRSGLKLPHYSPWPTPASEGVNAFSQPIPLEHNIYAFLTVICKTLKKKGRAFRNIGKYIVPSLLNQHFFFLSIKTLDCLTKPLK